jgi:hypothetical protein
VYEGVNELATTAEKAIPLLEKEGGCAIKKDAAKPPLTAQTGWSTTD